MLAKHGLLVSVIVATTLVLCRGMDTNLPLHDTAPTTTPPSDPPAPPDPTTTNAYVDETTKYIPAPDLHTSLDVNSNHNDATVAHDTLQPAHDVAASVHDNTNPTHDVGTTVHDNHNGAHEGAKVSIPAEQVHAASLIDAASTSKPEIQNSAHGSATSGNKCSYTFINKNKYDPRTEPYDNVTQAMEAAFKKSPLAIRVFSKFMSPKSASHVEQSPGIPDVNVNLKDNGPVHHPDLLGPEEGLTLPSEPKSSHRQSESAPSFGHPAQKQITEKIKKGGRDFNVNNMFNSISDSANGFDSPITKFHGVLRRDRPFGFNSDFLDNPSHNGFLNGFSHGFRRKRMAVPPAPHVYNTQKPTSVCEPQRKVITAFVKEDHLCYVYKPHVQGIEMDLCKREPCSACSEHSTAQCIPQKLSTWVWAYCPKQGEEISPEYLEFPAYCSCMVMHC